MGVVAAGGCGMLLSRLTSPMPPPSPPSSMDPATAAMAQPLIPLLVLVTVRSRTGSTGISKALHTATRFSR